MRLLIAITVCCSGVILLVALALARRIRLGQRLTAKPKPIRRTPACEFFEAGEFRTPRPLHLDQEIFKQKPRRPLSDINAAFGHRAPLASKSVSMQATPNIAKSQNDSKPLSIGRPAAAYATLFGQKVSISQIERSVNTADESVDQTASPIDFNRRIPPQAVRASGLRRRVDLSHFNKDLGDPIDPHATSLRGSRTPGPAAIDNRYRFRA